MAGNRDDPETRRCQLALVRHAIIGELDIEALSRGERSARSPSWPRASTGCLTAASGASPPGRSGRGGGAYHRAGFEGLLPKARKDRGQLKAVNRALLDAATALRRDLTLALPPRP